jgi:hypothetical protein
MEKIEINTPEPEKAIPILRDALEGQKRIILQSLARTQERVQELAQKLNVNPDLLLSGAIPHPDEQDMDLLELEGELGILRQLKERLERLEHIAICS